jgi:ubiquinone/menaquinone biosynthesis C-methylase UbiE
MSIKLDQSSYWNTVASKKTFNHELDWSYLQKNIKAESKVLDYGCGYGRIVHQFLDKGYNKVTGVDSSEEMIKRGLKAKRNLNIKHIQGNKIPFADNSFDLVLLIAVLTCIPFDEDQAALMLEINRVLKPKGLLYVSDLLINSDIRNKARYEKNTNGRYGVFNLDEGAVLRHHNVEYLKNEVFNGFTLCYHKEFDVVTMNGNRSKSVQIIGEKN